MDKIKTQNKRAFTLTELLIVVIVIGVLSAVTLPKFNRVIENRKVTEAEEMMSAVRTEQERRCSLDKNYTTKFSNLQDIIASNTTKNYTYSLQKQGISAKSNNADYTLKILSYEDGSYCCEGDGCKKLNKNYPDCAGLSFPESDCAGTESGEEGLGPDPEGKECTDGEVQGSQTCNGCGTQTTQLCVNGKWTDSLGTCSKTEEECKPKPVECPEPKPTSTEKCSPCGEIRSRSVTCGEDGQWVIGEWNAECKKEGECPAKRETCNDARDEGRLDSFCARYGLFADSQYSMKAYHKPLTAENCCHACPDNCVIEGGKCITPSWEVVRESTNEIAVKYSPSASTAYVVALEKSPGEMFQYGGVANGGVANGGVCDFSVPQDKAISTSSLELYQDQLPSLCAQKCGSQQECDAVIYGKRGDWVPWIEGYVGGDTCCKLKPGMSFDDLFANQTFYNTKNMKADWWAFRDGRNNTVVSDFSQNYRLVEANARAMPHLFTFPAQNPTDDKPGDPAYGLRGGYQEETWAKISSRCQSKSNISCTSVTGIPNAKKESFKLYSTGGFWSNTHHPGGTLTVTTTYVDVSYVNLDKYTCKRRANAGNICYPEGM